MPASLTHMLISRRTRDHVRRAPDERTAGFVTDVLDRHPHYMELGSLGPDLPYFGWRSLLRPNKPIGVDQWSYQLHSKSPNILPLRLIELAWKESDPKQEPWVDIDKCKFSFICGFLTHLAADQTVHPVVNSIAGCYHREKAARTEHKNCEIHQDLYMLSEQYNHQLTMSQFHSQEFHEWCNLKRDSWKSPLLHGAKLSDWWWVLHMLWLRPPCPIEFVYFLQRGFVEAHAVAPSSSCVARWIRFVYRVLRISGYLPRWFHWYRWAFRNLFDSNGSLKKNSEAYRKYILLEDAPRREGGHPEYVEKAIELAAVYVEAAFQLYRAPRVNDDMREAFMEVVVNADLGSPLERDILATATNKLKKLKQVVDQEWAKIKQEESQAAGPEEGG